MDKLEIVMGNYIDVDCDANTAPRQAYERGFRRAAEKCETVMRSRKIENDQLKAENDQRKVENEKLREAVAVLWECCAWETGSSGWCEECDYDDDDNGGCKIEKVLRELGIGA